MLTVSPEDNFNGSIVVSILASDGQASGSGSFTLTVNAVNDAPTVSAIDNQTIDEDNPLIIPVFPVDIDGDELTLSASGDNVTTSFDGTTLTVIPDQDYNCLLYPSPSPRDGLLSRMPSSA